MATETELTDDQHVELAGIIDTLQQGGSTDDEIQSTVDKYVGGLRDNSVKTEGVATKDAPVAPVTESELDDSSSASSTVRRKYKQQVERPDDWITAKEQVVAEKTSYFESFEGKNDGNVRAQLTDSEYKEYLDYLNGGEVQGNNAEEAAIVRSLREPREHQFEGDLSEEERSIYTNVGEEIKEGYEDRLIESGEEAEELRLQREPINNASERLTANMEKLQDSRRDDLPDDPDLIAEINQDREILGESVTSYNKNYANWIEDYKEIQTDGNILDHYKRNYGKLNRLAHNFEQQGVDMKATFWDALNDLDAIPGSGSNIGLGGANYTPSATLAEEQGLKSEGENELERLTQKGLDLRTYKEKFLPKSIEIGQVNSAKDFGWYAVDSFINNAPSLAAMSLAYIPGVGSALMPAVFGAMGLSGSVSDTLYGKEDAKQKLPALREQLASAKDPKVKQRLQRAIQYHERYSGITNPEKWTAGLMHAGAEIILERVFTVPLLNSTSKTARALAKKDVQKGIKEYALAYGKSALIPVEGFVTEAATEGLTQIVQNWADMNILGDRSKGIMDGVTEAMIQGGLMGGVMTTGGSIASAVSQAYTSNKDADLFNEGLVRLQEIEMAMTDPSKTDEEIDKLYEESEQLTGELTLLQDIGLENFMGLGIVEMKEAAEHARDVAGKQMEIEQLKKKPTNPTNAKAIEQLEKERDESWELQNNILDRSLTRRENAMLDNPELALDGASLAKIEKNRSDERVSIQKQLDMIEKKRKDPGKTRKTRDKNTMRMLIMKENQLLDRLDNNTKVTKRVEAAKKKMETKAEEKAEKTRTQKKKGIDRITNDLAADIPTAKLQKKEIYGTIFPGQAVPTDQEWSEQLKDETFLPKLQAEIKRYLGEVKGAGIITSSKDARSKQMIDELTNVSGIPIVPVTQGAGKHAQVVYGKDGKPTTIEVNKNYSSVKSVFHELSHVWAHGVKADRPTLYNKGIELVKQMDNYQTVYDSIQNNPDYADIHGNEDAINDEILARSIANHERVQVNGWKKWIQDLKSWIADKFNMKGKISDDTTFEDFAKLAHFEIATGKSGFTDIVGTKEKKYSRSKVARTRAAKAAEALKNKEFRSANNIPSSSNPIFDANQMSKGAQLKESLDPAEFKNIKDRVNTYLHDNIETPEQNAARKALFKEGVNWHEDAQYDVFFTQQEDKRNKDTRAKKLRASVVKQTSELPKSYIPIAKATLEGYKKTLDRKDTVEDLEKQNVQYTALRDSYYDLLSMVEGTAKKEKNTRATYRKAIRETTMNIDLNNAKIEKDLNKQQNNFGVLEAVALDKFYTEAVIPIIFEKKDLDSYTYKQFVGVNPMIAARESLGIALAADDKINSYSKKISYVSKDIFPNMSPNSIAELREDAKTRVDEAVAKVMAMDEVARTKMRTDFKAMSKKRQEDEIDKREATLQEMIIKRTTGYNSWSEKFTQNPPKQPTDLDMTTWIEEQARRLENDIKTKIGHRPFLAYMKNGKIITVDQLLTEEGTIGSESLPLDVQALKEDLFNQMIYGAGLSGKTKERNGKIASYKANRPQPYPDNYNTQTNNYDFVNRKTGQASISGYNLKEQDEIDAIYGENSPFNQPDEFYYVKAALEAAGTNLDLEMNDLFQHLSDTKHGWWTFADEKLGLKQRQGKNRERKRSLEDYSPNRDGKPFYDAWGADLVGRWYPRTKYVNIQGSGVAKSQRNIAIVDHNGRPILNENGDPMFNSTTQAGVDHMYVQAMMTMGVNVPFKGELVNPATLVGMDAVNAAKELFKNDKYLDWARDPRNNVGGDYQTGNDTNGWSKAKEPEMFVKTILGIKNAIDYFDKNGSYEGFISQLPIYKDATNSAIQFYSGLVLDAVGGKMVNLVAGEARQDGYSGIFDIGYKQLLAEFNESQGYPADRKFVDLENSEQMKALDSMIKRRKEYDNMRFGVDPVKLLAQAKKKVGANASQEALDKELANLRGSAWKNLQATWERLATKDVGKTPGISNVDRKKLIRIKAKEYQDKHFEDIGEIQQKEENDWVEKDGVGSWVEKQSIRNAKQVFWLRADAQAYGRDIAKANVMLKAYTAGLPTIVDAIGKKLSGKLEGYSWDIGNVIAGKISNAVDREIPGAKKVKDYLQSLATNISSKEVENAIIGKGPLTGFNYYDKAMHSYAPQVKLALDEGSINPYIWLGNGGINHSKMKSAIAPNFIHMLDAQLLQAMVLKAEGKYPIQVIHDSFSTSPEYVEQLLKDLKETQAEIMDFLQGFKPTPTTDGKARTLEIFNHENIIEGNALYAFTIQNLGPTAGRAFFKKAIEDGKIEFGELDPSGIKKNDHPFSSAESIPDSQFFQNMTQKTAVTKAANQVGVKATGDIAADNRAISKAKQEMKYTETASSLSGQLKLISKGRSEGILNTDEAIAKSVYASVKAKYTSSADLNLLLWKLTAKNKDDSNPEAIKTQQALVDALINDTYLVADDVTIQAGMKANTKLEKYKKDNKMKFSKFSTENFTVERDGGGLFTKDQALMASLLHRNGTQMTQMSPEMQQALSDYVASDTELSSAMDAIYDALKVNDGEVGGFVLPQDIMDKFISGIALYGIEGNINRYYNKFFKQRMLRETGWEQARNEIFSREMKNKIIATFKDGKYFVDNLESVLRGMWDSSTVDNEADYKWVKGLTIFPALAIGGNVWVGVKQLISAVNFIEVKGPNNIGQFMAAFANPETYGIMKKIWQSDYAKNRLGSGAIDVDFNLLINEGQISHAKVLDFLGSIKRSAIDLAYKPVGFGDIGAIVLGGATYVLNYQKKFMAEGMSKEDAYNKAFDLMTKNAETTQQSRKGHKLSAEQRKLIPKLLLSFKTTPQQYGREARSEMYKIERLGKGTTSEEKAEIKKLKAAAVAKIIYYRVISNMLFALVSNLFMQAAGIGDDQDEVRKMGLQLIEFNLYGYGAYGVLAGTGLRLANELYNQKDDKNLNSSKLVKQALSSVPSASILLGQFDKYNYANRDGNKVLQAAIITETLSQIPLAKITKHIQNLQYLANKEASLGLKALTVLGVDSHITGLNQYSKAELERERKRRIKARKRKSKN